MGTTLWWLWKIGGRKVFVSDVRTWIEVQTTKQKLTIK